MSPLTKNITTVLVALSLAFVGYYLYNQNKNSGLSYGDGDYSNQEMLSNTQIFIERRSLLDGITLNTDILMDPVFQSYRTYRSPEASAPVGGRENPFELNSSSTF